MNTTSCEEIGFQGPITPLTTLLLAACDILFLLLLTLVPTLTVALDLRWLHNGVGEISITELLQEGVLLAIVIGLYWKGRVLPEVRAFLWLIAGFFGCLLIRELDMFFDMIWHGFWIYPALLLAAVTLLHTWRHGRATLLSGAARFAQHRSALFTLFGLLLVAVFSRVFGSGSLLWNEILGMSTAFEFKTALQEGIELLGYSYVAYGILSHGGYLR
ncbi:hypothetical protein [Aeromonas tecta]|uniref:hypothetical protein n=1 Tax=Aeromonas tecta TaxID=324617 RepID=UPI00068221D1|nr:hypothetical protein [Aeromonas tecta]